MRIVYFVGVELGQISQCFLRILFFSYSKEQKRNKSHQVVIKIENKVIVGETQRKAVEERNP